MKKLLQILSLVLSFSILSSTIVQYHHHDEDGSMCFFVHEDENHNEDGAITYDIFHAIEAAHCQCHFKDFISLEFSIDENNYLSNFEAPSIEIICDFINTDKIFSVIGLHYISKNFVDNYISTKLRAIYRSTRNVRAPSL